MKEEVIEDMRDNHSHSPNYEIKANSTSDGGQGSVKLMIPKYEQSSEQEPIAQLGLGQQPPLHEAVIEALAGPSGMQGVSFWISILSTHMGKSLSCEKYHLRCHIVLTL